MSKIVKVPKVTRQLTIKPVSHPQISKIDTTGLSESDKNTVSEITTLHNRILGYFHRTVEDATRIGELLCKQKEKLMHGEFQLWVLKHTTLKGKTANNYMTLYTNRDLLKSVSVTDLTGAYELIKKANKEMPVQVSPKELLKNQEEKEALIKAAETSTDANIIRIDIRCDDPVTRPKFLKEIKAVCIKYNIITYKMAEQTVNKDLLRQVEGEMEEVLNKNGVKSILLCTEKGQAMNGTWKWYEEDQQ